MAIGELPERGHPERKMRVLEAEVARLKADNEKLTQRALKAEWNYHLELGESRFLRALMLPAQLHMRCPNAVLPSFMHLPKP